MSGAKSKNIIAEKGQRVVGTKRSNSLENSTVVATVNATGGVTPPTIIFKGQRVQAAWLGTGENEVPGATYAATDSSFMQGTVVVNFF